MGTVDAQCSSEPLLGMTLQACRPLRARMKGLISGRNDTPLVHFGDDTSCQVEDALEGQRACVSHCNVQVSGHEAWARVETGDRRNGWKRALG